VKDYLFGEMYQGDYERLKKDLLKLGIDVEKVGS
jgi:hypothetical protein